MEAAAQASTHCHTTTATAQRAPSSRLMEAMAATQGGVQQTVHQQAGGGQGAEGGR